MNTSGRWRVPYLAITSISITINASDKASRCLPVVTVPGYAYPVEVPRYLPGYPCLRARTSRVHCVPASTMEQILEFLGSLLLLLVLVPQPQRRQADKSGPGLMKVTTLALASTTTTTTSATSPGMRYGQWCPGYPGTRVPSTRVIPMGAMRTGIRDLDWAPYPGTRVPGYRVKRIIFKVSSSWRQTRWQLQ
eukprot:2493531-Rhodomonas_salina.1